MLAPTAVICLLPFAWCYVLPKLGLVAWKLLIWSCIFVGFSAALTMIYLAIISAFDYLGAGVDGTLNSLSENLGEFSSHMPTPQGLTSSVVVLTTFVILVLCLPLIRDKISTLSNKCAGVPLIRIAPVSPTCLLYTSPSPRD